MKKPDYDNTFGTGTGPLWTQNNTGTVPLNQGTGFNSIVDALRMVVYEFPSDGGKLLKDIPDSEKQKHWTYTINSWKQQPKMKKN